MRIKKPKFSGGGGKMPAPKKIRGPKGGAKLSAPKTAFGKKGMSFKSPSASGRRSRKPEIEL